MWLPLLVSTLIAGRFAVVATAAEAEGQAALRYVDADADRVRAVLEDLGGVDGKNVIRVPNATAATLRDALARAEQALRTDPEAILFVYYSGHAEENGLLLGRDVFSYRELRELLARSTARTRVVLLDGCRTGGVVTSKGGRQTPAFDVPALRTETVRGAAIIAASTASEQAQESSRLEGSFFTHHLVAGLRGAADQDGDGRVSLAESYAYAYSQTLSSTSTTLLGPQHPAYQYDLAGAGELIVTDLARAQSLLVLPVGAPGDLFMVFDGRDTLLAEIAGGAKRPAQLALRAGTYRVTRRRQGRASVATVTLPAQARTTFDEHALREQPSELAMAKGIRRKRHGVFLDVGLVHAQTGAVPSAVEAGVAYDHALARWHLGARLSYGTGESSYSVYEVTRASLQLAALRRFSLGALDLAVGADVGAARFLQIRQGTRYFDPQLPDRLEGLAAVSHAVLMLDIPLGGPVSLRLDWHAGALLLRANGALRMRPELAARVGVGAHF